MALVITDNSPSAGYIAWTGLVITYKAVDYNINDSNSNKRYVWWDLDNPNDLQASDTTPTMTKDDCIVFINNSGVNMLWGNRKVPLPVISPDSHASGMIHEWGGTIAAIPTGWLHCNGASLLRTDYPDLFTAIGVIHGSVDGTHFTLPDLRDVTTIGAKQDDSGIPKTNIEGALTTSGGQTTIPAHTHTTGGVWSGELVAGGTVKSFLYGNSDGVTGSTGTGTKCLPPYKVTTRIIKT